MSTKTHNEIPVCTLARQAAMVRAGSVGLHDGMAVYWDGPTGRRFGVVHVGEAVMVRSQGNCFVAVEFELSARRPVTVWKAVTIEALGPDKFEDGLRAAFQTKNPNA